MLQSLRCGAKTRKGTPCMAPAVQGVARCRMHGGAKGSGAPLGNQNAFKHGAHTAESKKFHTFVRDAINRSKEVIK